MFMLKILWKNVSAFVIATILFKTIKQNDTSNTNKENQTNSSSTEDKYAQNAFYMSKDKSDGAVTHDCSMEVFGFCKNTDLVSDGDYKNLFYRIAEFLQYLTNCIAASEKTVKTLKLDVINLDVKNNKKNLIIKVIVINDQLNCFERLNILENKIINFWKDLSILKKTKDNILSIYRYNKNIKPNLTDDLISNIKLLNSKLHLLYTYYRKEIYLELEIELLLIIGFKNNYDIENILLKNELNSFIMNYLNNKQEGTVKNIIEKNRLNKHFKYIQGHINNSEKIINFITKTIRNASVMINSLEKYNNYKFHFSKNSQLIINDKIKNSDKMLIAMRLEARKSLLNVMHLIVERIDLNYIILNTKITATFPQNHKKPNKSDDLHKTFNNNILYKLVNLISILDNIENNIDRSLATISTFLEMYYNKKHPMSDFNTIYKEIGVYMNLFEETCKKLSYPIVLKIIEQEQFSLVYNYYQKIMKIPNPICNFEELVTAIGFYFDKIFNNDNMRFKDNQNVLEAFMAEFYNEQILGQKSILKGFLITMFGEMKGNNNVDTPYKAVLKLISYNIIYLSDAMKQISRGKTLYTYELKKIFMGAFLFPFKLFYEPSITFSHLFYLSNQSRLKIDRFNSIILFSNIYQIFTFMVSPSSLPLSIETFYHKEITPVYEFIERWIVFENKIVELSNSLTDLNDILVLIG